jgi:phage antirepressor YoqD-like protein
MLTLSPPGAGATMTSREIADLTEKEHRHVVRDIEVMLEQLKIDLEGYAQIWTHPQNQQKYRGYELSEELTLNLVAGYSAPLRLRIIRRWKELEKVAMPTPAIPPNYAAALRLAADQQEVIQAQAEQLVAAAPAVAFVDRYVDSTGLKGFRQVCKLLRANENDFRRFLEDEKVMYRLGGEWTPFAHHLDTGRFDVKAGTATKTGHAFNTARFTPKGVAWVAGEFAKWQLRQKESFHA